MDSMMENYGNVADVVFTIEGTAINGAYINELKSNYIQPTLEYFSAGPLDPEREYIISDAFATKFAIVLYRTSNPMDTVSTYGPFSSPRKVMEIIERLPLVGGGMDSCANVAEGFATAHCCFDEMKEMRGRNFIMDVQRHCILICNSPPYSMPVMENYMHIGKTVDQLATLFHERKINLSIIAPRKLPVFIKLFMKGDGDQPFTQKNYGKNIRHLVLLRGYHLKERPPSPNSNQIMAPQQQQQQNQIGGQQQQMPPQQLQQQQQQQQPQPMDTSQVLMPNPSQNQLQGQQMQQSGPTINIVGQQAVNAAQAVMNPQQVMQQQQAFVNPNPNQNPMQNPGNFQPNMQVNPQNRWIFTPNQQVGGPVQQGQQPRPPFMGPVGGPMMNTNNPNMPPQNPNSALISQLSAPPNQGMNPLLQQQQMRMQNHMQLQQLQQQINQQQQQQQQNQIQNPSAQPHPQQAQQQQQQQQQQAQQPQNMPIGGGVVPAGVPANQTGPSHSNPNEGAPSTSDQTVTHDRLKIWSGAVEWIDKLKPDHLKITRAVNFSVTTNIKNGEPEIKADNWPPKLFMQMMPKHLVANIGGQYLKESKMVVFVPTPCESLDALLKVMNNGFAGCVHFSSAMSACDIKVLLLLFSAEKNTYLGFIPNNQTMFVDRLRKVIHQKQLMGQQQPGNQPPGGGPMQQQQQQQQQQQPQQQQQQQMQGAMQSGMMQQNTLPPNVLAQQQQQLQQQQQQQQQNQQEQQQHYNQYAQQMSMQMGGGGPMGDQMVGGGGGNIGPVGGSLQHQQQMAMLQQQQQRMPMLGPNAQQQMQQMPPHATALQQQQQQQQQRMVRPMMANNSGLRHLLQQQSTPQQQFRPQMVGGPGPNQMGVPGGGPLAPNRPFDENNFEFM